MTTLNRGKDDHGRFRERHGLGLRAGLLALFAAALTACGVDAPKAGLAEADVAQQVDLTVGDTRRATERRYGGEVVVWRPEAGFAVLATGQGTNLGVQQTTEPDAVVAGSDRSWSGGARAWSGGARAWSGGDSGGGAVTLEQNGVSWRQIGLAEAWAQAPRRGQGVKIAVIDTGLDLEHPAFRANLAPAGEWYDFVDDDALPQEEQGGGGYGHGTAVAGIALQVAPGATVLPLRVLGPDGSGLTTDVAAAIDWAVRRGADVVHLSLGTEGASPVLETMVGYAAEQGVYVTASAGNVFGSNTENDKLATVTFPAAYALSEGDGGGGVPLEALSVGVGSVDAADQKSSFSRFGEALELVAPGETVYSPVPGDRLAHWNGTSVAAPMVAGALALALGEPLPAASTGCLAEFVGDTAADVSGDALEDLKGRLDAGSFVARALSPDSPRCSDGNAGEGD